jgi:hypothetical protein
MSLQNLISTYKQLRDSLNADAESIASIIDARIPAENEAKSAAEGTLEMARHALRKAITDEEIQNARIAIAKAEENLANKSQLVANLEAKVGAFQHKKMSREMEVEQARNAMWQAKRAQLLEALKLDSALKAELDNLIAVSAQLRQGWLTRQYGYAITEKFDQINEADIQAATDSLITDMGLNT